MANYYANTLNQRTLQSPEFSTYNYNSRGMTAKPSNDQYQALPNVGKMTISQMQGYYPSNSQSITNYHYAQMEKNRSLSTAKYPPQIINQSQMQNNSNVPYSQVKAGFHDTLNRNFFNSQYVYHGQKEQMPGPQLQYVQEKKDNYNQYPNDNYNNQSMSTMPRGIQPHSAMSHINNQNNNYQLNQNQIVSEYQYNQGFKPVNSNANNNSIQQRLNNNCNTPLQMPIPKTAPKTNYVIEKWSATSKAGKEASGLTKTNQDSYIYKENRVSGQLMNIIGVFDGHGPHGHFISKAIKTFFTNAEFNSNSKTEQLGNSYHHPQVNCNAQQVNIFNDKTHSIIKQKFEVLSSYINSNKGFDSNLSGSTCVIIFVSDNKLICANCGDSRAIMIQDNGKVIPLSRDHKPELPDEMHRIINQGGRVEQVQIPYLAKKAQGPYRVWLKYENYPGLAMSRSIGDQVAKSIGVTSEPEISEFNLTEVKPKMIIVASDGVWEFLSNNQVNQIVMPYYSSGDCDGASKRLVEVAHEQWKKEESVVDDITAVVLFLHKVNHKPVQMRVNE